MKKYVLFTFISLLFLSTLWAQNEWSSSDKRYAKSFKKQIGYALESALKYDWEKADYYLEQSNWYLNKWKDRGMEKHPKVKPLLAKYKKYKKMFAAKKLPLSDKVYYIRRKKGKANPKFSGTQKKPCKYLWRLIKECKPGDTIRLSGPVYGWRGTGEITPTEVPHLTFKGGYNFDFTKRNPVDFPTVLSPKKDARAKSLSKRMFVAKNGTGMVIDGIIFDQNLLNIYKEGNLDLYRSPQTNTLFVKFQGNVTIRNCVFLNSSGGALRLIANGPGTATVENCIFLNNVHYGIHCQSNNDDKGKFIIRNNTFALTQERRSAQGTGILLGKLGTLVCENNIFAYQSVGITSLLSNNKVTLKNNVIHNLKQGFYYYSAGSKISVAGIGEDLEEVELTGEVDGNQRIDPQLNLDALSLLKFLKNKGLWGISKEVLAREIARAKKDLDPSKVKKEEKKEEKKTEKKPKKDDDDPFGDGGFGDEDKDKKKKDKEEKEKKSKGKEGPIPTKHYYGQVYPWKKGWVFPQNPKCKAGARPVKTKEVKGEKKEASSGAPCPKCQKRDQVKLLAKTGSTPPVSIWKCNRCQHNFSTTGK